MEVGAMKRNKEERGGAKRNKESEEERVKQGEHPVHPRSSFEVLPEGFLFLRYRVLGSEYKVHTKSECNYL